MKTSTKTMIGVAALAAVGLAIYVLTREKRQESCDRLAHVADEGYETAHDVLYPNKYKPSRLQYGPVLPK
ncbi:MAG: hypothetical protein EOO06_11480 [Chitinophagaceae bacterium]|nr:MAG: hypothetical protein EOO06_11480 [Chitinophagaceae bacterium]